MSAPRFESLEGGRITGALDGVERGDYVTVAQLRRVTAFVREAAVGAIVAALRLADPSLAVVLGALPSGFDDPASGARLTSYGHVAPGRTGDYDLGTRDNGWRALYQGGLHGAMAKFDMAEEEITLSTVGATTDSVNAALLPANGDIRAVMAYTTQTILGGGVASISIGDAAIPTRFVNASAALLAFGARDAGIRHLITSGLTGQAADASVRITANGGTPTQGRVRVVRVSVTLTPPTS